MVRFVVIITERQVDDIIFCKVQGVYESDVSTLYVHMRDFLNRSSRVIRIYIYI